MRPKSFRILLIVITGIAGFSLFFTGCMRYLTHDRGEVVLEGVDIDQSLSVAKIYMDDKQGSWGASLAIWAIRDQYVTPDQAQIVSGLYFEHIDGFKKEFDVWHLTWAVANIYRHGDNEVKKAIGTAYTDATKRARELSRIANKMANGDTMHMGDAHSGGRAFAKSHVVVPGNKKYLQSADEYREKKHKKTESK